ncbi:hypothetical protein JW905_11580, partial [bacterium]|nr:hypothetical protein [candidate division CSSED10-310 bacterium]
FYIVASRPIWWGGWCPAGRFLVPILSLAAIPLGAVLSRRSRMVRWLLYALLAYSAGLQLRWMADPMRLLSTDNGRNELFAAHHLLSWLNHVLPSVARWQDATPWLLAAFWLGILAGVTVVHSKAAHRGKREAAVLGIVLVAAMIATAIVGITVERRVMRIRRSMAATPLASSPPQLIAPAPGGRLTGEPPVIRWQAVTGADSYRVRIAFPDGYLAEYTHFDPVLELRIPRSVWNKLPAGEYRWSVTPLKKNQTGQASGERSFIKE